MIPPEGGWTATAEESVEVFPEARAHAVQGDGIDAGVDVSQAESNDLLKEPKIRMNHTRHKLQKDLHPSSWDCMDFLITVQRLICLRLRGIRHGL